MRKTAATLFVLLLAPAVLANCGGDDEDDTATTPAREEVGAPAVTKVTITAEDYGFDVPPTFKGGLVELDYRNAGQEPHFAAFAAIGGGKTAADVKAALTAPPSNTPPAGPPPFEDYAGMATMDPGGAANAILNLPAGGYVLYCAIPAPDGVPHVAKGMAAEVTVSEGADGDLPETEGTFTATDFKLSDGPELKTAGRHVVGLSNEGKQFHEIDLIELPEGKTVDDVSPWFKQPSGPPPMRMLGGPAITPGEEVTTTYDLKAGVTYAFICGIPDFLGDFVAHVSKGMHTGTFTVS